MRPFGAKSPMFYLLKPQFNLYTWIRCTFLESKDSKYISVLTHSNLLLNQHQILLY
jgi:hypothetical protein